MGAIFSCFGAKTDKEHTASLNVSGLEVCQCLGSCLHQNRRKDTVQLTTQETSPASLHIHDNLLSNGGESAATRSTRRDTQQNACIISQSSGDNLSENEGESAAPRPTPSDVQQNACLNPESISCNFSSTGGESAAARSTPSGIQQNACIYLASSSNNFTNNEITPDRCASSDHSRVRPEPILPNVIPLNSETIQENKRMGSGSETGCPDKNSGSCLVKESDTVGSYFSFPILEDEDICATCLDEYDNENPKIRVNCSHHFHLGCIYDWMERSPTCPICRELVLFDESSF